MTREQKLERMQRNRNVAAAFEELLNLADECNARVYKDWPARSASDILNQISIGRDIESGSLKIFSNEGRTKNIGELFNSVESASMALDMNRDLFVRVFHANSTSKSEMQIMLESYKKTEIKIDGKTKEPYLYNSGADMEA